MTKVNKKLFKAVLIASIISTSSFAQWTTTGNNIGATDWIGGNTLSTNPFVLKTYGIERFRILSNTTTTPFIGINNNAPALALDLTTNGTNDGIRIANSGTTAAALHLQNNGTGGRRYGLFSTGSGSTQGAGAFVIYDYTATSQRFIIDPNGNVGVGNLTAAPLTLLHVSGGMGLFTTNSGTITSAPVIRGTNSYSSATIPDFSWYNNDQTGMYHPASNNIGFSTGGVERLRIDQSGNIGLGTTPTQKLDVAGNARITGTIFANSYNQDLLALNNWDVNWSFGGYQSGSNYWMQATYWDDLGPNRGFRVANRSIGGPTGETVFSTNKVYTLIPFGNVGIGTNTPGQKLEVNGSVKSTGLIVSDGTNTQFKVFSTGYVRARDITVDALAIPDYVFEKDYPLASIEEVDAFIKQHKHLPGIPSAKEIEKEGMSVSQMQSKLLEKVEELTLHLIQHETEILKLKEENERLKAVIGNR